MNSLLKKFTLVMAAIFFTAALVKNDDVQAQSSEFKSSNVKVAQVGRLVRRVGTAWIGKSAKNVTWLSGKNIYRTSRGSVIGSYGNLSSWIPKNLPGGGIARYNRRNAHHIIPKAHAKRLFPNENLRDMPAVNISRRDHMEKYHGRLNDEMANIRRRFPDLNNPQARNQTWGAYQRVYAEHPDWLDAIRDYF